MTDQNKPQQPHDKQQQGGQRQPNQNDRENNHVGTDYKNHTDKDKKTNPSHAKE